MSLLQVARDGEVTTQIWPNGTAYRRVEMAVVEPKDRQGARRLFEDHFDVRPSTDSGDMRLSADWRIGVMDRQSGAALRRTGRWLLDMHTTYQFEEQVEPSHYPLTESEKRRAQELKFTYELEMPGTIDESSVYPPAAYVDGGTARWTLTAADAPLTVKATSRQFKCGNATALLYLALWVGGWAGLKAYRRIRARPKRI
jgi:hypothetical protein